MGRFGLSLIASCPHRGRHRRRLIALTQESPHAPTNKTSLVAADTSDAGDARAAQNILNLAAKICIGMYSDKH